MLHQFDFYHLRNGNFAKPAISIAEKVLANSDKLLIIAPKNELSDLSVQFWSYKTDSFLAHGMGAEDVKDFAPIWLSSDADDNPIAAEYVMLTNGVSLNNFSTFKRVFNIFDGSSQAAIEQAREQWRDWSSHPEHFCRYFTQSQTGGWHHTHSNSKK